MRVCVAYDARAVPGMCAGRSSPRHLLLAVDASGYVMLLTANSGRMLMTQQITAGPPLAVNVNSELQCLRHGTLLSAAVRNPCWLIWALRRRLRDRHSCRA